MSRALRLAAGWTIALAAALILTLALAGPMTAPEPAVLAGATSPTPSATAPPASPGSLTDALPDIPHWPPPDRGAGGEFAALPPEYADALRVATDRARKSAGVDILAVGMSVRGELAWTGVSGLAHDGVTVLDGHSPFGIASITKTFTAALVLQLIEEGRFAPEDEIASLLPDAGLPAGVTVEQLLTHTSGIADLLAPMREPMNADRERIWTGPEVIANLGAPWFAPGAGYAYSNSNYVILGMLVEHVTGRPFADELAMRLLEPLGLNETGILAAPEAPPLMTPSWASAFGTSGNMYSSTMDLLKWADALYEGDVLRRDTRRQMLSFGSDGYGLGAQRILLGTRVGHGHSGLLRGFTSLLVHLPVQDVTLVVIGTWQGFEPADALMHAEDGQPSILDIALRAAAAPGEG